MTIEKEDNFSIVEFVNLAISAAWSRSYGEKAISIGFQPRDHVAGAICDVTIIIPGPFQNWNIEVVRQGNAGAGSAPATIRVEKRERCNRGILSRDA